MRTVAAVQVEADNGAAGNAVGLGALKARRSRRRIVESGEGRTGERISVLDVIGILVKTDDGVPQNPLREGAVCPQRSVDRRVGSAVVRKAVRIVAAVGILADNRAAVYVPRDGVGRP